MMVDKEGETRMSDCYSPRCDIYVIIMKFPQRGADVICLDWEDVYLSYSTRMLRWVERFADSADLPLSDAYYRPARDQN
jgi:hypothetical protein